MNSLVFLLKNKMNNIATLISQNNWKKAFSLSRKYFFGIPKDEMRNIEIASDCLNNKQSFYIALGIDTNEITEKAKAFLITKFCDGIRQN